jgi:hypothetical protein
MEPQPTLCLQQPLLKWLYHYHKNKIKMSKKALYITAAILLIAAVVSIRSCINNQIAIQNLKENLADTQTVKIWKDKYEKEHYQVKDLTGNIEMMKIVHAKIYDSLANILKIKPKEIIRIAKTDIVTHDTIIIPAENVPNDYVTQGCDTFKQTFNYADQYTKIKIDVKDRFVKVDYQTEDTLTAVTFIKHTGFLGLYKATYTDFTNSNPRSNIRGLKTLSSVKVEKRFGFGIQVGYGLSSNFKFNPYIGVGLQYNLFRF